MKTANAHNTAELDSKLAVIDVGCGAGHMAILASLSQGSMKNVYAIDSSREMCKQAQK
jgi:ubiquinone/menaquinone biosynthesis C-methylase UbiE